MNNARASCARLEIGASGQARRQAKVADAVRMAINNWSLVPASLVQMAWVKTGYATWEEIQQVTGANQEAAQQLQRQVDPHAFGDLLGPDAAAAPTVDEMRVEHEKAFVWQLHCPNSQQWSHLPQASVQKGWVLSVHTHTYMYMHIYICIHICIYIHMFVHICIYTHALLAQCLACASSGARACPGEAIGQVPLQKGYV